MSKIIQIKTLNIHCSEELTEKEEMYFEALSRLVLYFGNMDNDNRLCLSLISSYFFIGIHSSSEIPDPLVFIKTTKDYLYDVDKEIFSLAVKEFEEEYLEDARKRHPELSDNEIKEKAILDFVNDKLDFFTNSRVVSKDMAINARHAYFSR